MPLQGKSKPHLEGAVLIFAGVTHKYLIYDEYIFLCKYRAKIKGFLQSRRIFVHNTQKEESCRERQAKEGYFCEVIS